MDPDVSSCEPQSLTLVWGVGAFQLNSGRLSVRRVTGSTPAAASPLSSSESLYMLEERSCAAQVQKAARYRNTALGHGSPGGGRSSSVFLPC